MTVFVKFVVTLELSEQPKNTNHMERMLFEAIDRQLDNSEITESMDPAFVERVGSVELLKSTD